MRMQKTDMEFVTFDAQDILTTSGPAGNPMAAQLGTIAAYNNEYAGGNGSTGTITANSMLNSNTGINGFDNASKANKWITYNVDNNDEALRTAEAQSTDNKPTGSYYWAKTAQNVYDWLVANGHSFQ